MKNTNESKQLYKLAIIFLCVALIAGFVIFYISGYSEMPFATEIDYLYSRLWGADITVNDLGDNTVVESNVLQMSGHTLPHANVTLLVNGSIIDSTQTDEQGNFNFANVKLEAGNNNLRLTYESTNEWFNFKGSKIISVQCEGSKPTVPGPDIISRSIVIGLGERNSSLDFKLELSKDDRRVRDFFSGSVNTYKFIENTVGDLTINNQSIVYYLSFTKPAVEISDHVSIRWQIKNIYLSTLTPSGQNSVDIKLRNGISSPGSKDSIIVLPNNYEVTAMIPQPESVHDGRYAWGKSFFSEKPFIQLGVRLQGFGSLLAALKVSPYDWDYPFSLFVNLALSILFYIPAIWILLILRRKGEKSLARATSIFVTLHLMIPGFGMFNSVSFRVRDWIPHGFPYEWTDLAAVILAAGFLIAIFSVLFLLFELCVYKLWPSSQLAEAVSEIWKRTVISIIAVMLINIPVQVLDHFHLFSQWLAVSICAITGFLLVLYTLAAFKTIGKLFINFKFRYVLLLSLFTIPLLSVQSSLLSVHESFYLYDIWYYTSSLFDTLDNLWMYIPLLFLVLLLKRDAQELPQYQRDKETFTTLFMIVFAGYIVGVRVWMLIPVSFLFALGIKRYLLVSKDRVLQLHTCAEAVHERRKELIQHVIDREIAEDMEKGLEKLEQCLTKGDIAPDSYEAKKTEIKSYMDKLREPVDFLGGTAPEDIVFAVGPCRKPWENGLLALKRGLCVTIPFSVIYLIIFLQNPFLIPMPYYYLLIIVQLLTSFLSLVTESFFFGYCFEFIRGANGLKKSFRVSLLSIACYLPLELLSIESLPADIGSLALRAALKIIFFAFLGAAFDLETLRRNNYTWRRLSLISDVPSLAALVPAIIGSIGTTVIALLTGRLGDLVSFVFNSVIPQIPK